MTKIYYGPSGNNSDSYRLVPAPTLSIATEFNYANDTIIGYTYNLTLNGQITNYRNLTNNNSAADPDYNSKNIQKVIAGMDLVRQILSRNGSVLEIKDDSGDTVIKAKGGTLRSLDFSETDNNWSAFATYTAQIEFNEIEFLGETIGCGDIDIDPKTHSSKLIDISKHKIKTFSEGWSFSIGESSFDYVRNIDTGSDLRIHNMVINASYNISVTGKNYYIDDQLIPAHEQARIFAQKRLYDKVMELVVGGSSHLFKISKDVDSNPCGSDSLNTIHTAGYGILGNITYLPHNETISCELSESGGSFSANYSCILKSKGTGMTYSSPSVIHTVNKSHNASSESNSKINHSINVSGNIQGLYLGGLIYSSGNFRLPSNGSLIVSSVDLANKYSSADGFYSSVGSDVDLTDSFKTALGITYSSLGLSACPDSSTSPRPSSFNLTRNYIDGTITYNAEYNNTNCLKTEGSIQSINFTVDNETPILAEFIVPRRGVIIQDIATITAKKINVTISGRESLERKCCNNVEDMLNNLVTCTDVPMPSGVTLPDATKYILTQKQRSDDKLKGTYNISLSYICASGCEI
jgi:hypothetical protein